MPKKRSRKKKRGKKSEIEHNHLSIRVDSYDVMAEASVNHYAYDPRYAWDLNDDDPLYKLMTRLEIVGISVYPKQRASDRYEVTIYGEGSPSRVADATLKDIQVRDEYNSPQYRTYRGRQIPVYQPPPGMGLLEKVRGEPRWTAWIPVKTSYVSDLLILLGQAKQLYIGIHECKADRARWVRSISLQTTDPATE